MWRKNTASDSEGLWNSCSKSTVSPNTGVMVRRVARWRHSCRRMTSFFTRILDASRSTSSCSLTSFGSPGAEVPGRRLDLRARRRACLASLRASMSVSFCRICSISGRCPGLSTSHAVLVTGAPSRGSALQRFSSSSVMRRRSPCARTTAGSASSRATTPPFSGTALTRTRFTRPVLEPRLLRGCSTTLSSLSSGTRPMLMKRSMRNPRATALSPCTSFSRRLR
mmetsp:Transcript_36132/g.92357  ORF Transcript_36132/g.92357 Transcript_36132/m.92357 type:complete len:224 (-) Transcript_36132:827-1498(-)